MKDDGKPTTAVEMKDPLILLENEASVKDIYPTIKGKGAGEIIL
jgi:hypothetical protein